jgi:hypothetical protein
MVDQLHNKILEINLWKRKLMDLWDSKGETDQEVIEMAEKVDHLLNEYYRLYYCNGIKPHKTA